MGLAATAHSSAAGLLRIPARRRTRVSDASDPDNPARRVGEGVKTPRRQSVRDVA